MSNKGFSLVELAISVTIIGVLIAGVVKGQEVIQNARITATIAQALQYDKALSSFNDVYVGLPGDFAAATTDIPGCVTNATCADGNGDGVISKDGLNAEDWLGWGTTNVARDSKESIQFWKHLAVAGLIEGVDVFDDGTAPFVWGESHPSSPLGGGVEFFYDQNTAFGPSVHVFRFSRNGINGGGTLPIMSPLYAQALDRKADDGQAWSGRFVVDYGSSDTACHDVDVYKISNTDKVCTLYYVVYN